MSIKEGIIDVIRRFQRLLDPASYEVPEHKPEMLLIGCVDARLNPAKDLGIPQGKAIIHRSIGALVGGLDEKGKPKIISEAASVQFAVEKLHVKHIAVMGHTHCGGMQGCLHCCDPMHEHEVPAFVKEYLKPLEVVGEAVFSDTTYRINPSDSEDEQNAKIEMRGRVMEKIAVEESVINLMSYPFVRDRVLDGSLQVHGWIVDTATHRLSEMPQESVKAIAQHAKNMAEGKVEPLDKDLDRHVPSFVPMDGKPLEPPAAGLRRA
ncbi:MAG: carbonic anhydrase [Rickettsiales bacterium]|nr:carbonic anhydrase [Rickettsiales bacterium]